MRIFLVCISVLSTALAVSVGAQPSVYEQGFEGGSSPSGDGCEEGEVPDDGTVEAGYGWLPSITYAGFVERFDAPSLSSGLERVCICVMQAMNFPPDFEQQFQIVVYDDDGLGGAPGTVLASIPAIATNVRIGLPGAFYAYNIAGQVPFLPSDGSIFIGIEWQPNVEQDFFICVDKDSPPHGGYTMSDTFPEWTPIQESSTVFSDYGALVVRAVAEQDDVVEIPTLGGIGLAFLASFLLLASLRTLTRRRRVS